MNYRIHWTTEAYLDFSQIVLFIKEKWGGKSAEDFVNRVETIINILSVFPQLGKIIHSQKQIRALVISKQTTIVYRIKSELLVILNLFDNRQNPDKFEVNENKISYVSAADKK